MRRSIGLLLALTSVNAAFDCKIQIENQQFDLNPLKGLHSFTESTSTPPTITKTLYELSLCSPLPPPSTTNSSDSCPSGTYICSTTLTSRSGLEDRIISVVPIAGEIGEGDLEPKGSKVDGSKSEEKWNLNMKGGSYNGVKQSMNLELVCDTTAKETIPSLTSYDAINGVLALKWITASACVVSGDGSTPPPTKDPENGGDNAPSRGYGFFGVTFILIICAILAYFVLGSYYNYSQYGATGLDMIPHRDLWRDVPYIIGDLFKSRGSSRSGYSALG